MKHILSILLLTYSWLCYGNFSKEINIQRINIEEGLSQYTINSIYQDEFGFVWIGTLDGLNRYDGSRIDVFKPNKKDSLGIHENNIRHICGDRNGHLFIKGLESVSLYDIETNTFKTILEHGVRAICWENGVLWIALGSDIYTYDLSSEKLTPYFSFPDRKTKRVISSLWVTDSDELCFSTVFHGFYRIGREKNILQHIPMVEANSISGDSKGNIWIASRGEGLYRILPDGTVKRYKMDPVAFLARSRKTREKTHRRGQSIQISILYQHLPRIPYAVNPHRRSIGATVDAQRHETIHLFQHSKRVQELETDETTG